tara:strand:+ start:29036 stop:31258 length:2223 start_codon:yes stop_codon:yes gene_type:complete
MDEIQYLEITSSRRDRNINPLPAMVECPISLSGQKSKKNAIDPVSLSAPIKTWVGNRFNMITSPATGTTSYVEVELLSWNAATLNGQEKLAATTTSVVLEIGTKRIGELQTIENYYVGATIGTSNSVDNPTEQRRIISYKFLGPGRINGLNSQYDRAQIIIENSLPGTIGVGIILTIKDPTDFGTSFRDPLFFVPDSLPLSNNYVKHYLYNYTKNQNRPIKGFDTITRLLTIDTSGSTEILENSGPIGPKKWETTDVYMIIPENQKKCFVNSTPIDIDSSSEGLYLGGGSYQSTDNPPTHTSFNFDFPAANYYRNNYSSLVGNFLTANMPYDLNSYGTVSVIQALGANPKTTFTINETINTNWFKDYTGYYIGAKVRIISNTGPNVIHGQISTVISSTYNPATQFHEIVVNPGFSAPVIVLDRIEIQFPQESQRIVKYEDYRQTLTNPQPNTVRSLNLPIINNVINYENTIYRNGYLKGLYIRVASATTPADEVRLIGEHQVIRNGDGKVIQVLIKINNLCANFTNAPAAGDSISITSGMVASYGKKNGFTYTLSKQPFCILPYSYDNLYPFINAQGINADSSYLIELINIILPNQVLNSGFGSLISFYQYVYVEIENNTGNGTSAPNNIMSNNPRAINTTFRCTIDDVPNPVNSSFIKIDGDGMKQVLRINPCESMKLRVYLGTGRNPEQKELFEVLLPESFSPLAPNPRIQISACFSFKKIKTLDEVKTDNPIIKYYP